MATTKHAPIERYSDRVIKRLKDPASHRSFTLTNEVHTDTTREQSGRMVVHGRDKVIAYFDYKFVPISNNVFYLHSYAKEADPSIRLQHSFTSLEREKEDLLVKSWHDLLQGIDEETKPVKITPWTEQDS